MTSAIPPRPRRPLRALAWAGVTAAVVLAFWSIEVNWGRLADLPAEVVRYLWLMFSDPNWEKLPEALWQTWRSIEMAWLRALLRGLFALIRAVPEIIIAIVILSVTGLTPFTGALALAVNGIGTLGKWGYEAVEAVPAGPIEAARAAGGSTTEVLRWGVWPQAAPAFWSFWLYRFEINVRSSAVLGLIGVGGIGDMLTSYTQYREWATVGVLLIVVVAATVLVDAASGAIRRRITEGGNIRVTR